MINIICDALSARIQALNYIGNTDSKVTGLVKTALRRTESRLDSGEVYNITEQRFPVARNVVGTRCQNTSQYKELTPDSTRRAVIYFEQNGNETIAKENNCYSHAVNVRMVVWLNMKKMGINELDFDCAINRIKYDMRDELSKSVTANCQIDVKSEQTIRAISEDVTIFSKYTYDDNVIGNMLLYPYSYFAIDFDVRFKTGLNCFNFTLGTEIIC